MKYGKEAREDILKAIYLLRSAESASKHGRNLTLEKKVSEARVILNDLVSPKTKRNVTIVEMAKSEHEDEGTIEVDDNAIVSEGDDNGAYVEAWVWVSFSGTPYDKDPDAIEEDGHPDINRQRDLN